MCLPLFLFVLQTMSFPPRPPMGLPIQGRIIPPAFGYAPMGLYYFADLHNKFHMFFSVIRFLAYWHKRADERLNNLPNVNRST